ncbi:MAG: hypothetical protein ACQGVK_25890 [Myxococcota bacterium]
MAVSRSSCAVVGLVLTTLVNGCATFPDGRVADVDQVQVRGLAEKPSVYVLPAFESEQGTVEPMQGWFKNAVRTATNAANLFGEVSYDAYRARDMDYIVKLEMNNHASPFAAVGAALIVGLTVFIVPAYATDHYTLRALVVDQNDTELDSFKLESYVRYWFGIWLLPFVGKSPWTEVPEHMERMVLNAYQHFASGGVFTGRPKPDVSRQDD